MAETIVWNGNKRRPASRLLKVVIALTVLVIYFLVTILALFLVHRINIPFQVPSHSMSPAIQPNDRIMVNRLVYGSSPPERGDIIAFKNTVLNAIDSNDVTYVKRVTGIPGDIVEVRDGQVLVNDEVVPLAGADQPRYEMPPQTVPEGKLFVLGDNINESSDSHIWGPVSMSDVTGRVDYIYWPLSDLTVLSRNLAVSDVSVPAFFLFSLSWPPVACAIVAARRNRSKVGWFFLGLLAALLSGLLSIVPLTILILLEPRERHATLRPETT